MKAQELIKKITSLNLETFSTADLRKIFPESAASMAVIANRLVKNGQIVPIYKGLYRLAQNQIEIEKVAQQIYYPSYTSFESALAKYGIINQGPYLLTLATTRHAKKIIIDNRECLFRQLKPGLFWGFNLIKDIYLAEPEKAVLDTLYLAYLGKTKINYQDWYLKNINRDKIKKYARIFSRRFSSFVLSNLFQ